MAYRCTNPFSFAGRIVSGGALVEDDDSILDTHARFFAHVAEAAPTPVGETASVDVPRARKRTRRGADLPDLPVDEAPQAE